MDSRVLAFNAFAIGASAYAFAKGGAPERIAGASLLAASMLTRLVRDSGPTGYVHPQLGVLAVDMTLLSVLVVLALYADRFWPFWIVALHALGTTAHVVKAIDPSVLRLAYAILVQAWAYPITVILIVATVRHRRRLLQNGRDPDWSIQPGA
ncbi:hypothetical protein [Sphingomonas sp. CROZ-RG-20F-R02-07]|uniref:hypothetical protein n=1 Tax=Sphingomonas sp. CROZ-RG-20F-R02-07 TaxID=2914832 RepID=UPI001F58CEAE|nr:hypothetical protein [Sphingomonas sp. CROZ-RG-20F-R02-07]